MLGRTRIDFVVALSCYFPIYITKRQARMEDIGISILLPASQGPWSHYELTGQLKMEPQDFLVSEISMDGKGDRLITQISKACF